MSQQSSSTSSQAWQAGVRVWIEQAGQAVLGPGRAELLEAIARTNSISAAARQLGMSYRRAWELVQAMNQAASESLVSAAVGGKQGGGARLTAAGQRALEIYSALDHEVRATAAGALLRAIGAANNTSGPLRLAAAVSLQEVVGRWLNAFALVEPTQIVSTVFGASNELADLILGGARCDLFIAADEASVARVVQAGRLTGATRQVVAMNRLALIGPQSSPSRIARLVDLRGASIARVAVASRDTPLGSMTYAALQRAGCVESVGSKTVWVNNSQAVVGAVRAGLADVGLAFLSDADARNGVQLLWRSRHVDDQTAYVAAYAEGHESSAAARRLIGWIVSEAGQQAARRAGLGPIPRAAAR